MGPDLLRRELLRLADAERNIELARDRLQAMESLVARLDALTAPADEARKSLRLTRETLEICKALRDILRTRVARAVASGNGAPSIVIAPLK